MRIVSSQVDLRAQSTTSVQTSREERVRAWVGEEPERLQQTADPSPAVRGTAEERMSISEQAREIVAGIRKPSSLPPPLPAESGEDETTDFETGSKEDIDSKLLEMMLHMRRLKWKKMQPTQEQQGSGRQEPHSQRNDKEDTKAAPSNAPQKQGWGIEIDISERRVKSEAVSFSAKGSVETSDGRSLAFREDLKMERIEVSERELSLRAGDAVKQVVDPLVVNLDGGPAELGAGSVSFDIDADGTEDNIAALGDGHAFLALDRNEDGLINDGSELFGPKTGDGFGELATLDEDKSGWIDEGDSAFAELKVWRPDASGTSSMQTLASTGIGAIYVGAATTRIDLGHEGQQARAIVQKTGITLREDGAVGTIQHVDFKA